MATIRLLEPADAAALREQRLASLRLEPDAYLATLEEDEARPERWYRERLQESATDLAIGVMGAFEAGLVGFVGFRRAERQRVRHKASIWGTWVTPSARRAGIGRALMTAVLDRLRAAGDIERVLLSVTAGQAAARGLYVSLGFVPFGLERRAMKIGERYVDEELFALELW